VVDRDHKQGRKTATVALDELEVAVTSSGQWRRFPSIIVAWSHEFMIATVPQADPSTDSTTITALQIGTIMSSTPSSRRRTTSCLLCIESDAIVGKFQCAATAGGLAYRTVSGPKPSFTETCACPRHPRSSFR